MIFTKSPKSNWLMWSNTNWRSYTIDFCKGTLSLVILGLVTSMSLGCGIISEPPSLNTLAKEGVNFRVLSLPKFTSVHTVVVEDPTFSASVKAEDSSLKKLILSGWNRGTGFQIVPIENYRNDAFSLSSGAGQTTSVAKLKTRILKYIGSSDSKGIGTLEPALISFKQELVLANRPNEVLLEATFFYNDQASTDNLLKSGASKQVWYGPREITYAGFLAVAKNAGRVIDQYFQKEKS